MTERNGTPATDPAGRMKASRKTAVAAIVIAAIGVIAACVSSGAVADGACKRADLEWPTWRDHVLASNPGTDVFELRGDGRDELLKAFGCLEGGDDCPPDEVMVFHCTGNSRMLIAFVTQGCVTKAKEIPAKDYMSYVTGGEPC